MALSSIPRAPRRALWCGLLAAGLLGACASHSTPISPTGARDWSLRVDNQHWLDVRIYVVHGGQRTRVGMVTAAQTHTFRLPAYLLGPGGDIRLYARPVGNRAELETEVIIVALGQRVDWFIPHGFEHSAVSVH
jgi:hypothetical protein